jgi:hypothetical protein
MDPGMKQIVMQISCYEDEKKDGTSGCADFLTTLDRQSYLALGRMLPAPRECGVRLSYTCNTRTAGKLYLQHARTV